MPYAIPGTSTGGDLYRSVKPVPWNSHELLIFCLTSVLHYSLYSRVVIIVDQRFLILRFSLKILGGRTNNKHISFGDDKDFRSPGARIRTSPSTRQDSIHRRVFIFPKYRTKPKRGNHTTNECVVLSVLPSNDNFQFTESR